ncbi:MAG: hypothetical protein AB1425_11130 [Actinomycetota bacterium]
MLRPKDALRVLRNPPGWLARQMAACRERGNQPRLLLPLAAAVAYELCGDPTRREELLPVVETFMSEWEEMKPCP